MANPALTEDAVSPGAVAWVLTSTAFVFLMTAGLGFFYGGLVRDTNIINTMMMSVVSMGIVTLTWVVFLAFSWAFGDNGSTGFGMFVGNFDYSLWMDLDMKMWGDSGLPAWCSLPSRWPLPSFLLQSFPARWWSACVSVLTASCLLCVPSDLRTFVPLGLGPWRLDWWDGALDFAGGTVVHISSGVSGLVAGGILGPRRHVEKDLVLPTSLSWSWVVASFVRLVGIQRRFCSVRHGWSCSPCGGHHFCGVSLIHADLVGPGAHLEGQVYQCRSICWCCCRQGALSLVVSESACTLFHRSSFWLVLYPSTWIILTFNILRYVEYFWIYFRWLRWSPGTFL